MVGATLVRHPDTHQEPYERFSSYTADYVASMLGHYRRSREHLLYRNRSWGLTPQQRVLAWLRDHVHPSIPDRYYRALLGHPLHLSVWAELYMQIHRASEYDPFTAQRGWIEDLGRVSCQKVTTAFRDFEALNLVTDSTAYGDFKYHEVGLSSTAEDNTQTALVNSSGITRVAGSQSNPTSSTYQTVATVTADTSETWNEHGLFNTLAGATMMDRSVLSPNAVVQPGDTVSFTYVLTKAAEP